MKHEIILLITAFISVFGFSLLYGLRRRYLFAAALGGLLTVAVYILSDHLLQENFLPYLIASAFAALFAELLAHLLKCPAILFLTPSILPLVPGGSLYYTMSHAVHGEMQAAMESGQTTAEAALAIAAGISIVLAARQLGTKKKGTA